MIRNYIIVFVLFVGIKSISQTLKSVKEIETSYQNCLDKGENMRLCSVYYYTKADSILNVAYKNLRKKLNDAQKNELKKEQLLWLKKRDQYFKKEYANLKKINNPEEGSSDFDMIYYDKKSQYVIKRVKELINRL